MLRMQAVAFRFALDKKRANIEGLGFFFSELNLVQLRRTHKLTLHVRSRSADNLILDLIVSRIDARTGRKMDGGKAKRSA
jgi:hypothetical protein